MSPAGRPPGPEHVALGLKVPPGFKRALQLEAIERGMTMSEIVVEAVQARGMFVDHQPVTAPKPVTTPKGRKS